MRGTAIGFMVAVTLLSACESTGPKPLRVTGTWQGFLQLGSEPDLDYAFTFSLEQAQSNVTGSWVTSRPVAPDIQFRGTINGAVSGDTVTLSLGPNQFDSGGVYIGTVNAAGNQITGQLLDLQLVLNRH